MDEKKIVTLAVRPKIEGVDEVEAMLDAAMAHVMAAQDALERVRAATLTVTALVKTEEPAD